MTIKNILENILSDADSNIKKAYLDNQKYFFEIGNMITEQVFKNKTEQEKNNIINEMEKIILSEQRIKEEEERKNE